MTLYQIKYSFLFLFIISTSIFTTSYASNKPFVVVLDAGHGGHDSGNSHHGFVEKVISLNITLQVGAILEKDPRFKVIYTREKDTYPTLDERTIIANKAKADFFISIHCNAVGGGNQAYGVETFVLGNTRNKENLELAKKENSVIYLEEDYKEVYGDFDPSSPASLIGLTIAQEEYLDQSIQLASMVQHNITKNLKKRDRSVKQGPLYVLARTVMPSILIEVGFLSNKNEGAYLNSAKGQTEMAREIANAIKEYRSSLPDLHSDEYLDDITPDTPIASDSENSNKTEFMVQIGASQTLLETKPFNFKGLDNISRIKEGNLYKYFYGKTYTYEQAQQLQKQAKQKGYPDCFIVAYQNGKQVRLVDVLKTKE